jgi:hypothetical protein
MSTTIPKVKIQFFGRQVVKSNWRKLALHPLSRFGIIVMRNARQSIGRLTKKKTTPPRPAGRPPRMRSPKGEFKLIFSVPQDMSSVIIGMVGFGAATPVPGLHEHGGTARRQVFAEGGFKSKHTRKTLGRYAKRTAARRFRRRGGKLVVEPVMKKKTLKIAPRPFMLPAFIRAKPKLRPIYHGALNRY